AAAAEDRIESWDRTGPMFFHAQNRGQHRIRPAEPEVDKVVQAEREQIVRMIPQNLFPDRGCLVRIAVSPEGERVKMRSLAGGGVAQQWRRRLRRRAGDR